MSEADTITANSHSSMPDAIVVAIRNMLVDSALPDEDFAGAAESLGEAAAFVAATAMQRVFEEAQRLSGLTDDDVEELAEGFEPAPSEPGTSA